MTEIYVDVPALGRMANTVASVGAIKPADSPADASACGSSAVTSALRALRDARADAFSRILGNVSTLGVGMLDTANDFSKTDEEIIATITALDP